MDIGEREGSREAAGAGLPERLRRLVPPVLVAGALYLVLTLLAAFLIQPIAYLRITLDAQETLFVTLLVDTGPQTLTSVGNVVGEPSPERRISLRLPIEEVRTVVFGFHNGASRTPKPVGVRSVELILGDRSHGWTPRQIGQDFFFPDVGSAVIETGKGGEELLRLTPIGPKPAMTLRAGLPDVYREVYLPAARRFRATRIVIPALSAGLLAVLLLVPATAAARLRSSLRRLAAPVTRRARFGSPGWHLLVWLLFLALFAVAFPNVSLVNHQPRLEALDDFLVIQYYVEGIIDGFLPLWNPFVDNGQPFTWSYVTASLSHVTTWYALLLSGLGHVVDFNVNHAVKLLLLIHMAILALGLLKLFSHLVPDLSRGGLVVVSAVACSVYACWYYSGLYITVLGMYEFLPFCLLYALRFLDDLSTTTLWKLVLSFMLMTYASGIYIVPLTLILLNFALVTALFSGRRLWRSAPGFLRRNPGSLALMALTLAAGIGFKAYLYLTESAGIVRIGRDFTTISFEDFLQRTNQGAMGLERFALFFLKADLAHAFLGALTVFLVLHALLDRVFWRRRLPIVAFVLFVGSVALMEHSPFLRLYYDVLMPGLTRFAYWGIYYDVLLIFYLLFVADGAAALIARFSIARSGAILAAVLGLYAVLLRADKAFPFSLWFAAGLVPVLAAMWLCRRRGNAAAAAAVGSLVFLLLAAEQVFHLSTRLDRSRVTNLVLGLGDEPAFRRGVGVGYEMPRRRSLQVKRDYEIWMFGIPMVTRTVVFNPENRYVTTRMQQEAAAVLDNAGRLAKYGFSRDLLWFGGGFRVAGSREEMLRLLRAEPSADVLLVPDPGERARVAELLGRGDAATLRASRTVLSYGPNHVTLEATVSGPCVLYYSDTWHKDWRVTVNGERRPVYLADGAFKGVVLPAEGTYRIEFRFLPLAFVLLFALGNLAPLVPVAVILRDRRREPAAGGAPPGGG